MCDYTSQYHYGDSSFRFKNNKRGKLHTDYSLLTHVKRRQTVPPKPGFNDADSSVCHVAKHPHTT